ncbi:hypothetical protein [Enterococcus rivorum]|uniref:hypothetical protein n=1 Tax=Enterococcus rivorum TaxID=762845 RepID=UPI00362FF6B1
MFRLKNKRDQLSTKRQLAGSNSARNEPISFLTGVKRAVNSNKQLVIPQLLLRLLILEV